jgi:general secretion pathway protein H
MAWTANPAEKGTTKTLPAGKTNNRFFLKIKPSDNPLKIAKSSLLISKNNFIAKNQAFTLIELIVVMALMSILLFFSIPRLDINIFSDDNRNFSTWIIFTVKSLKEKAQQDGVRYVLYVDMDNNQMWSGLETKPETEESAPKENTYKLPEGMRVLDVEFPGMEQKSSGIAEIYFYPKGYSDKALIHIQDKDHNRNSYVIEPFLSEVKIYDHYIEF